MLDDLRKPLFILALVLIAIAVMLEAGAAVLVGFGESTVYGKEPDGFGVPSLALLDSLVILTVVLMGISLLLPERAHGRLQGIGTLIVSLLVLLGAIALLFLSIAVISLMLGLLLAPIFGTAAYFVLYADFDRDAAAMILSLVMLLKIGFVVCLVLAQQRFLENKGLVLLIATSLLAVLVVSFLHGFVPGFLVSITDMVAAIIVAVLTLIWAIVFLIGSVISVFKAIV